ncbi:hypothetical protein FG379_000537 [Cryptosporidium bovis]|uniref:uncharacterized protein n=1 Tax=Cryptosporidium bovis TaxID=310047 RepID=UPI00351A293E|nr:hypothetical protein FG379_000537 [Cryptosporidium bovis]
MIRIFFIALLIFYSFSNIYSSEQTKFEENNVIEIIPNKPYYGVEVNTVCYVLNTDKSYIIKINTKYLINSRYQLECHSAGPDPQGEFIIKPFTEDGGPEMKLGKPELILNRLLPNSIFYSRGGFYTSKLEKLGYVENGNERYIVFEMNLKMKKITYSQIIESKPILISLIKYNLVEKGSIFIFSDKNRKRE